MRPRASSGSMALSVNCTLARPCHTFISGEKSRSHSPARLTRALSGGKHHTAQLAAWIAGGQAQMRPLAPHAPGVLQRGAGAQHRRGVAHARGLHALQRRHGKGVQIAQRHVQIVFKRRYPRFRRHVVFKPFVQRRPERSQRLPGKRQPRRLTQRSTAPYFIKCSPTAVSAKKMSTPGMERQEPFKTPSSSLKRMTG